MERPRCPTHGLLVGDDGCLRCLRESEPKRRNLGVPVVAGVVGLILLVMIGARAASAGREAEAARAVAEPEVAAATTAPMATAGTTDTTPATGALATTLEPRPTRAGSTAPVPATAPTAAEPSAADVAFEAKLVPVTLYSASYCGWCTKAKEHMNARGIAYSERRIDENPEAKREMHRIGGTAIPTIDIEGDVRSGFSPEWVEHTLAMHARRRAAAKR
jgi:glutaredoxin